LSLLLTLLALGLACCDDQVRPVDAQSDEGEDAGLEQVEPSQYRYVKLMAAQELQFAPTIDTVGLRTGEEMRWADELWCLQEGVPAPCEVSKLLGPPDSFIDWPYDSRWCELGYAVGLPGSGLIFGFSVPISAGSQLSVIQFSDCVFIWFGGIWDVDTAQPTQELELFVGPTPDFDSPHWIALRELEPGPFHVFEVPELPAIDD
jgi:hypothetical protein